MISSCLLSSQTAHVLSEQHYVHLLICHDRCSINQYVADEYKVYLFIIFTLLCCNIVCSFSSFWLMVSYLICILEICQNYEYKIKNKWKQVPKVHMFSFLPNIMKYYHDQSLSTFWLKKLKVPHPEIILWMLNSTIIWSYFRMRRIKLWSPTSGCGW